MFHFARLPGITAIVGCVRGDNTVDVFTDRHGRAFRDFVARLEALFTSNSLTFIYFHFHLGEVVDRVCIEGRDEMGADISQLAEANHPGQDRFKSEEKRLFGPHTERGYQRYLLYDSIAVKGIHHSFISRSETSFPEFGVPLETDNVIFLLGKKRGCF